jgi:hypothetical protein
MKCCSSRCYLSLYHHSNKMHPQNTFTEFTLWKCFLFACSVEPKKEEKKYQVYLCVQQKLELDEKLESCVSICMEYGVKKQTVCDSTKQCVIVQNSVR